MLKNGSKEMKMLKKGDRINKLIPAKQIDYILYNWCRISGVINDHLAFFIKNESKTIKLYLYGILVIPKDKKCILKSDEINIFYKIIIEGCLTTSKWNSITKKGGFLNIYSLTNIIIKSSGIIDVNGCGYKFQNNIDKIRKK